MLKIKLQAEFERLKVTEYQLFYPATIYINTKSQKKTTYTVSVLKCENIQGSFLLYYARKIDLSTIQADNATIKTVGGTLSNSLNVQVDDDSTALQYLVFKKRLLVYADENNGVGYIWQRKIIYVLNPQTLQMRAKDYLLGKRNLKKALKFQNIQEDVSTNTKLI